MNDGSWTHEPQAQDVDGDELRLVRVAPFDAPSGAVVQAGPFTCAPTRSGLTTRFTSWEVVAADASLHPED